MWNQMNNLNTLYASQGWKAVYNTLKNDTVSWERYSKKVTSPISYYNNDPLRMYFYYGYYDEAMPLLEDTDLGEDVLKEVRDYVKEHPLRIEPYFVHSSYKTCIVFASPTETFQNGSWTKNIQVIFNHDDQHWYYLKASINMVEFNDTKTNDTSTITSAEKWKNFVENTLQDTEKAIRLE